MDDLAKTAAAAMAELNQILAPLQRLGAELRELDKLKLSDSDRRAIAEILRGLGTNLAAVAASASMVGDLATTLKQVRTGVCNA